MPIFANDLFLILVKRRLVEVETLISTTTNGVPRQVARLTLRHIHCVRLTHPPHRHILMPILLTPLTTLVMGGTPVPVPALLRHLNKLHPLPVTHNVHPRSTTTRCQMGAMFRMKRPPLYGPDFLVTGSRRMAMDQAESNLPLYTPYETILTGETQPMIRHCASSVLGHRNYLTDGFD